MILTAKIKLYPSKEQEVLLKSTILLCNLICNEISLYAKNNNVYNKYELQKQMYYFLRDKHSITSNLLIRCFAKVSEAYLSYNGESPIKFKPLGAIPYNDRIVNYRTNKSDVKIWLLGGRQVISFKVDDYTNGKFIYRKGESDLLFKNGKFYLLASCDVPTKDKV